MTSFKFLKLFICLISFGGFCQFSLASKSYKTIWSSKIIEDELKNRRLNHEQQILTKLDEVKLYISKNQLKAAGAVMTLLKSKTTQRNDQIHYVDAYLDFRLGRIDSALRTLQKISSNIPSVQVKKCFLWLKISWDTQRWQEVGNAFNNCESVLAYYSLDELFYSKNLYNFSISSVNEESVSPSPFFYFYAPDFQKIEQWLSLLIKQNLEKVAIKHLKRIPDESLAKGNVRLLTSMSLWNAGAFEDAKDLSDKIPEHQKEDWNYLRLMTSIALSKQNWQLAWDTNVRVLEQKNHLYSSRALELLLGWRMKILELIKGHNLQNSDLFKQYPDLAPLAASMLYIKGLKQEGQNILNKYPPTLNANPQHQLVHWIVKQWISLRNNQMATFMNDAIDSCQRQVSFGCWLLLSGQTQNNLDKADIFPYDSVGEYFREQL